MRVLITAACLLGMGLSLRGSEAAAQSRVGEILQGVTDVVNAATSPPGPKVVRPKVVRPRVVQPVVVPPVVPPPVVMPYPQPVPVAAYPTVKRPAYIRIINPATNTAAASYTLDGYPYVIPPGYVQELAETYVIEFDRGRGYGIARYNLSDGTYTFTPTIAGTWELYHSP